MPNEGTVALLIQAGAVGIALALIGLLYFVIKMMREIQREHRAALERNTDAWVKNTEALTSLSQNLPHICRAKERVAL